MSCNMEQGTRVGPSLCDRCSARPGRRTHTSRKVLVYRILPLVLVYVLQEARSLIWSIEKRAASETLKGESLQVPDSLVPCCERLRQLASPDNR
jgi:hypothetical protein